MPTDLRKARELFLHAVGKLPPEQWADYTAAACGGDVALEQQLGALLQVHQEAGSFLAAPVFGLGDTLDQPSLARVGTQIGPYKLLQIIGEGGMGVVYMAEQTQPVQRKVALKVIKPGMDSRQVIARFEAERQALAMMDHVNIARVLDAGATDAGLPFFVMELVHGVPITKYCDDNHLTLRQRLELFVPVCQAIQHAHQKGIIHRDIKPSNVMITLYDGQPVPKVIDFGVAKAIEQRLTERTLFTQYGTMVGTLEYMSPEQAEMSALGVDTRSDIYSLGVLLFELLTGSTPLDRKRVRAAAYGEVVRMIKEEDSPRPSTRLSESRELLASISAQRHMEPAKLAKSVRGELDWIVMKSLEKDRNRRYATANGFAADVLRYLNDESVQACPASAAYHFKKFARRNNRLLATSGVVALALVVGTAVSTWQAIRATTAEGQANTNLKSAEAQRQKAQEQVLLTDEANVQGLHRLYEAELAQVKAGSLSRRPGQRLDSLETLANATALARELKLPAENNLRLRNAAIACLALSDLRLANEWVDYPLGFRHLDFDGNLEHCAIVDDQGAVRIYRVKDNTQTAYLPKLGAHWVELTRDGDFVVVYATQGLQVWSLAPVEPVLVCDFPAGMVVAFDFSSDGRQYALLYADGTITVNDLVSAKSSLRLPPGTSGTRIALSPNNQEIAVGSGTGVQVRDLNSGEVTATLQHPMPVDSLVWHPNSKMLAVSGTDSKVYLWDTSTGKANFVLGGFVNGGIRMTFSHSGNLLATTGWEAKMRLWDSRTGQLLCSAMSAGGFKPRFSANDHFLSTSRHENKVGLWEVAECNEYRTPTHQFARPNTPYFNPSVFGNGKLLAVGAYGGVGVWELSSGRELSFLALPGTNFTATGPSGSLLTNGSAGLLRWDVTRNSSIPGGLKIGPPLKLAIPGSICDVASSHDGRVIASAQFDGGMVLHADRPDRPVSLVRHDDARYVSVSPDGKLVVTGSHNDSAVNIWNSESGALVKRLTGASWRATFSPDGKWLSSVAGGIRLWKVGTWEEGPKIGGGEGAAFSPVDAAILAVESGAGSIRLLDPNTGSEYARLEDPNQDRARHITFSPDGTQLIATNDDSRSIHVWDLRLIRTQLAKLDLDWDLPAYPPPNATDSQPLSVEFDETVTVEPE